MDYSEGWWRDKVTNFTTWLHNTVYSKDTFGGVEGTIIMVHYPSLGMYNFDNAYMQQLSPDIEKTPSKVGIASYNIAFD